MSKPARAPTLLDHVRPTTEGGPLRSVILTTYGLALDEPPFFEQDFLPTLLGLGGVRDRGYAAPVALTRKLAEARPILVCDAHALQSGARPRIHVDVLAIGHRTQHAKVVLLHRRNLVRLIVSSANLTDAGYRRNRECAAILDFRPGAALPLRVLDDAIEGFLGVLGSSAPKPLRGALAEARLAASEWKLPAAQPAGYSTSVIFGGGPVPLWQQIADTWPAGEPIEEWMICSPFWPDAGGETPFEILARALDAKGARLGDARLRIIAEGDSPTDRAQPRFPFGLVAQLRERGFPVRRGAIHAARAVADLEEVPDRAQPGARPLHAKFVVLRGRRTALVCVGSANFTRKGFGVVEEAAANIEACVLTRVPASAVSVDTWIKAYAHARTVDWAACTAGDLEAPTKGSPPPPWPDFLARIELLVHWHAGVEPSGTLRFVFRDAQHPAFCAHLSGHDGVSETAIVSPSESGAQTDLAIDVDQIAVARLLVRGVVIVEWAGRKAPFPINVDEASKAGLPAVLGARPDEQMLLAYFHGRISEDDVLDMLAARARESEGIDGTARAGTSEEEAERVRRLQSYILRDFVEGLYGVEETLRRAAPSPRALEQALLGDLSPARLAKEIVLALREKRRSPTAAAFQLVELLRVVSSLAWPGDASEAERDSFDEVRDRAVEHLLELVRHAGELPAFREACTDRDTRQFIKIALPSPIVRRWNTVLRTGTAEPSIAVEAE